MSYDQRSLGVGGGIWVAGITMVIASLLAFYNVYDHCKSKVYPQAQKFLYFILLAPVFVGWPSWLVLVAGDAIGILEYVGDLAKALLVLLFTQYVIKMLGTEVNDSICQYSQDKVYSRLTSLGKTKHLSKCFGEISLRSTKEAKSFLRRIQFSAWQYLVVLVIITVLGVVLTLIDKDYIKVGSFEAESANLWISLVKITATLIAVYHLFLLSYAVLAFKDLEKIGMKAKFRTVQLAFMITQIQSTLIGTLAESGAIADTDDYDTDQISLFTTNLLMCVEMIILAFVQGIVFSTEDFLNSQEEIQQSLLKES